MCTRAGPGARVDGPTDPDDDHGEDPGVDEVLDPVADGVDGEETSLELWVEIPAGK